MWTNGREEVSRRETKRVFLARVGRRSINSRGPEVQRKGDDYPTRSLGVSLAGRPMGAKRVEWARGSVRAGLYRGVVAGPGDRSASVPRALLDDRNTVETSVARASERRA